MIEFNVTDQRIQLVNATPIGDMLVSGTVGEYNCKFIFNDYWNGYVKTAIFMPVITGSNESLQTYNVLLDENDECVIPYSALIDKQKLRVGVCGTTEDRVLPTIYSPHFMVRVGALPDNPAVEEDTGLYEQVLQKYAEVMQLIEDIDSNGVPVGGTQGQVLTKKSEEDYDMEWRDVASVSAPKWDDIREKPEDLVMDIDYIHTDNNFTDEYKNKLDGIEAGAEVNVLEGVNVNGSPLSITNKKVDIAVPTKTSDLTNDDGFATESFVNSSIGTNTAYYISDDGEPFESPEALEEYSGEATNNDYAFVVGRDDAGNVIYTRYKYNADNQEWAKEYVLNNSSFTDKQWQSINSEITASKVTQITTNKNDISNLEDTKMEYAILSFDGSHLKLDGVQKSFIEIKELCLNKKNFTYLLYSNRLYIPQYINENNVWFEASYIDNNIPYMHRIGINSRDAISVTTKTLAVKSDMDAVKESIETLESNVETLSTTIEQKADKSEIPDIYDDTEIKGELAGAVSAKKTQTFTDTEKIQARSNAGIHVLTQAEYDSITDHGNDLYIIVEE